jgi:hypothetical protein
MSAVNYDRFVALEQAATTAVWMVLPVGPNFIEQAHALPA